jgi:hypothetical protein
VLAVFRVVAMLALYLHTNPGSSSSSNSSSRRRQRMAEGLLGPPTAPNHEQVGGRLLRLRLSMCSSKQNECLAP